MLASRRLVLACLVAGLALSLLAGRAAAAEPVGDTLTVIQRPILNIPAIVRPGDLLMIECSADPIASGWSAGLLRGQVQYPLEILDSYYYPSLDLWKLRAQVPEVNLYELYDLYVSARQGIADTSRNAVRVIPQFKDDYYFIHITDTHLPTHRYYYEHGAETDSSEMGDLREIFKDVSIINPEFVVLTGDLINEGDLEDFLERRYFTRAQRLLAESDVPIYLTAGNHDIGGWSGTPVPSGTARQTWWRFFGWKRLDNPPEAAPARTQDYSFDYGRTHYVGLEAYNNYDGWRPEVYGSDSFTAAQMQWLAGDLAAVPEGTTKVLFYHSDFMSQINLGNLGVALALSGHTHSDANDFTAPYNIVTRSACDGHRAYRLIRVTNGVIQPSLTISAGSSGTALDVTYESSTNGPIYATTAHITNNTGQRFEHGQIRFLVPNVSGLLDVTGGTLLQVDRSGADAVCYVAVDIASSGTQDATVTLDTTDLEAPTVTVISPNGGETWLVGSTHDLTWSATDNVGVTAISLVLSKDGGATYADTIATGEANDGVYSWTLGDEAIAAARIRVVASDARGNVGQDGSDASFAITDGTPAKPDHLVIEGAMPNPFDRHAVIKFGLPADGMIEIDLYDVSGRRVATLARAPYEEGYRTLEWTAPDNIGPGLYFLSLAFEGETVTAKVVIPR